MNSSIRAGQSNFSWIIETRSIISRNFEHVLAVVLVPSLGASPSAPPPGPAPLLVVHAVGVHRRPAGVVARLIKDRDLQISRHQRSSEGVCSNDCMGEKMATAALYGEGRPSSGS